MTSWPLQAEARREAKVFGGERDGLGSLTGYQNQCKAEKEREG